MDLVSQTECWSSYLLVLILSTYQFVFIGFTTWVCKTREYQLISNDKIFSLCGTSHYCKRKICTHYFGNSSELFTNTVSFLKRNRQHSIIWSIIYLDSSHWSVNYLYKNWFSTCGKKLDTVIKNLVTVVFGYRHYLLYSAVFVRVFVLAHLNIYPFKNRLTAIRSWSWLQCGTTHQRICNLLPCAPFSQLTVIDQFWSTVVLPLSFLPLPINDLPSLPILLNLHVSNSSPSLLIISNCSLCSLSTHAHLWF